MKKILVAFSWLLSLHSLAQTTKSALDQRPEFIGGIGGFMAFIGQNLRYPKQLSRASITGKTIVKFRITERGAVNHVRVEQSLGFGMDKEITRVLKLTSGKWKPGKIRGKAIAWDYYLPLNIEPD